MHKQGDMISKTIEQMFTAYLTASHHKVNASHDALRVAVMKRAQSAASSVTTDRQLEEDFRARRKAKRSSGSMRNARSLWDA